MSRPETAAVPRSLLAVCAGVLPVGLVMIFLGGWRTGISWDEPYHVVRMRSFLAEGWYLFPHDIHLGEPGEWVGQPHVYSPATMDFLHALGVLFGQEGWGQITATAEVFAVRHLGVGIIAVLGLVAVALTTRILMRSWAWALVSAAVLVSIPMWTGHAMFNLKDIPTATGFSLVTLGLVLLAREHAADARRWYAPLAIVAGIVIGVGTRPGVWPGLAAGMGALVVLTLLREGDHGPREALRRNLWRYAELAAALVVAQVILIAIYPSTFLRPHTALLDSALASANYGGSSSPWWYTPGHLLIEMPVLLLLLGGIGTVVAVRRVIGTRFRPDVHSTVLVLVGLQVFLMPILAMLRQSNLYNGLRQLLFSAPAFAVLITLGIAVLLAQVRDSSGRRRIVVGVACVALAAPVLSQLRLFPYNYAYANLPTDLTGLDNKSDYWRTSVRELAPSIPTGGFVACSPMIDDRNRALTRSHDANDDCVTNLLGPLRPYAHLRKEAEPLPPTEFYAVFTGKTFGENCTELARVERSRHFRDKMMTRVARCELALERYRGPIEFGRFSMSQRHLFGGWSAYMPLPGIAPVTDDSRLGFELPDDLRNGAVTIAITTVGAEQMPLQVNGAEVETRRTADGFVADVPSEVATAYGEGRLVLSFRGDGELRVTGLSITAGPALR